MLDSHLTFFLQILNENKKIEISKAGTNGQFTTAKQFEQIDAELYSKIINSSSNYCFLNGIKFDFKGNRAGDKDVGIKNLLSFDIDFKDSKKHGASFVKLTQEEKKNSVATFVKTTLPRLQELLVEPAFWVFTGNGVHLHFLLEEHQAINDIATYKRCYDIFASKLQEAIGGEYELDAKCRNPARIMRLPGSLNTKPGIEPVRTEVLHSAEVYADELWHECVVEGRKKLTQSVSKNFDQSDTTKTSRNGSSEALDEIKKALTVDAIFSHYGKNVNKENRTDGQVWYTNPWRDTSKPLSDSTPSFVFDPAQDRWHCFGDSPVEGGDLLQLICAFDNLNHKDATQFKKAVSIASEITGVEYKKQKPKVAELKNYQAPNSEHISQLIAAIPLDTPRPKLPEMFEPVFQALAEGNETFDMFALEQIKRDYQLTEKFVAPFAKRIKDLRKAIRDDEKEANQSEYRDENEDAKPEDYFQFFEEENIVHDELSRRAVIVSEFEERKTGVTQGLKYSLRPRSFDFCDTRKVRNLLEAKAYARGNLDYRMVQRMLELYIKEKKAPQILIATPPAPTQFDDIMQSALGRIIDQSFVIEETGNEDPEYLLAINRFTKLEIVLIYHYCICQGIHRVNNPNFRPVIPVLTSRKENIGKDTFLKCITAWFAPYVKSLSFGKGSQEKELKKAFGTSFIQLIEEFDKITELPPASRKELTTAEYSDVTLKGDNETTRIYYRGVAFGSANNLNFLMPGTDNSRYIPIEIATMLHTFQPSLALSAQIYAQCLEIYNSGKWQELLTEELRVKIRKIQRQTSPDSESVSFRVVFVHHLKEALSSYSYRDEILEFKQILNIDIESMQLFEKLREARPEYRMHTDYKFRQFLKEQRLYRCVGDPEVVKRRGQTHRYINLPEEITNELEGVENELEVSDDFIV